MSAAGASRALRVRFDIPTSGVGAEARISSTERFTGEGHDRKMSTALDSRIKFTLMFSTVTGDATRDDLAPVGHETAHNAIILMINIVDLVLAEAADFSSSFCSKFSHAATPF